MKLVQVFRLHVWVLPLFAACGGRIDVAEVVLGARALEDDGSAGGELPLAATMEALPAPTLVPAPTLLPTPTLVPPPSVAVGTAVPPETTSGCFDAVPIAEFPSWIPPVPSSGCSYQFESQPGSCTATWYCCDDVFSATAEDIGNGMTYTTWTASTFPQLGQMFGPFCPEGESCEAPWQCPLEGYGAAEAMGIGVSYTPAWALAVSEHLMEAPPEFLDPIPIGCTYAAATQGCGASMICPEHTYYAGADGAGGVVCERDGQAVTPNGYGIDGLRQCVPGEVISMPIEACFGAGWGNYLQFAAGELN